jgi:hypothetical protein
MLVKCISNKSFPARLTVDKEYEVLKETFSSYWVKDDKGSATWYGKRSFMEV